jgi:hypothetical protein
MVFYLFNDVNSRRRDVVCYSFSDVEMRRRCVMQLGRPSDMATFGFFFWL